MIPWGFIDRGNGLVAVTSAKDRRERAELGETALALCMQLGVTSAQLEALRELMRAAARTPPDLVSELERLRAV